jgi:hypothetical protein
VSEPRLVYRFLKKPDKDASDFADNFMSDGERANGKPTLPGEHPEFRTGMSAFVSEAAARKRWVEIKAASLKKRSEKSARRQKGRPRTFKMSIGDHIGEVLLGPGEGFEIVDMNETDGHLTIRGDKDRLAARVADIYPAETTAT